MENIYQNNSNFNSGHQGVDTNANIEKKEDNNKKPTRKRSTRKKNSNLSTLTWEETEKVVETVLSLKSNEQLKSILSDITGEKDSFLIVKELKTNKDLTSSFEEINDLCSSVLDEQKSPLLIGAEFASKMEKTDNSARKNFVSSFNNFFNSEIRYDVRRGASVYSLVSEILKVISSPENKHKIEEVGKVTKWLKKRVLS